MTESHAQPGTVAHPHCGARFGEPSPPGNAAALPRLWQGGRAAAGGVWALGVERDLQGCPPTGARREHAGPHGRAGWTFQQVEGEAFFTDGFGRRHTLEVAHLLIQRAPERQFNLYQMAMNFWR
ncbi:hypothetical protein [Deinococcus hopiensis]|uniref:hypothetical protein n=1 Tax=Deinococcus hopiensis TaxID=309885 RepID=UPI00111C2B70|nr:hypothetical protein [Deinococcus hopiensis]